MTSTEIQLPHWRGALPEAEAADRLLGELDQWARSDALHGLATVWGGRPPDVPLGDLLSWYDDFSGAHWDYRQGAERNLAEIPELSESQTAVTLDSARRLGLATSRSPSRAQYDHVLVLGGLIRACIVRPRYAAELIDGGLDAGEVVALGGFRPLRGDEIDLAKEFAPGSEDEFEAMIAGTVAAFRIDDPPAYERPLDQRGNGDWNVAHLGSSVPISVIAAPSSEPDVRRANTPDTYAWWASRRGDIAGTTILLITTDIYVPYQGAGATQILGIEFGADVETVGVPATSANLGASTQLFAAHNYLQEIRSAIRGYRSLHGRVEQLLDQ